MKEYLSEFAKKEYSQTKKFPQALLLSNEILLLLKKNTGETNSEVRSLQKYFSDSITYEENHENNVPHFDIDIFRLDTFSSVRNTFLFHKWSGAKMLSRGRFYSNKEIAKMLSVDDATISHTISEELKAEEKSLSAYIRTCQDLD